MLIKHTFKSHLTYNYVGVHIRIEKYIIIIVCKLNAYMYDACKVDVRVIFDTYNIIDKEMKIEH
jgi:hypothetical protein